MTKKAFALLPQSDNFHQFLSTLFYVVFSFFHFKTTDFSGLGFMMRCLAHGLPLFVDL